MRRVVTGVRSLFATPTWSGPNGPGRLRGRQSLKHLLRLAEACAPSSGGRTSQRRVTLNAIVRIEIAHRLDWSIAGNQRQTCRSKLGVLVATLAEEATVPGARGVAKRAEHRLYAAARQCGVERGIRLFDAGPCQISMRLWPARRERSGHMRRRPHWKPPPARATKGSIL